MTWTGWRTWGSRWWPPICSAKARSSATLPGQRPTSPWSWRAEVAPRAGRSAFLDKNKLRPVKKSPMKSPINVVILAAGLGTRMNSKRAKVLHRAGGLTLVEHVVQAAAGITPPGHITVVIGSQADQVKAALSHSGVQFVHQKEQKGTGH